MLPDNYRAQAVTNKLRRLGIHDVQCFYDHQVKLWAICQVKKTTKAIITLNNPNTIELQPMLMWWCRNPNGTYRPPNDQDVHDVVATVLRAQKIFEKSESNPDWLDDQLTKDEEDEKTKRKAAQDERLRYMIRNTNIQKHIRKELG